MLPFVEGFHVIHVGVKVQSIPEVHKTIIHVPQPRQLVRPKCHLLGILLFAVSVSVVAAAALLLLSLLLLLLLLIKADRKAGAVDPSSEFVSPSFDALEGFAHLRVTVLPPVLHCPPPDPPLQCT